jgi:hypothetical protein
METMELGRLTCLVAVALLALATVARCDPQVPCYFIFGDSLVDNGNNNYIVSLARANYPPYGVDFPGGSSGRFTNGLTTVDVIGNIISPPCVKLPWPPARRLACCRFRHC